MDLFAPSHIVLILLIVLLMFGGKKIPELMRGLGKGMREFSDAKNSVRKEVEEGMREKDVVTPATTVTDNKPVLTSSPN